MLNFNIDVNLKLPSLKFSQDVVNSCDGRQICTWEEARLNEIFIDFGGICDDPYVSIRYTCIEGLKIQNIAKVII